MKKPTFAAKNSPQRWAPFSLWCMSSGSCRGGEGGRGGGREGENIVVKGGRKNRLSQFIQGPC